MFNILKIVNYNVMHKTKDPTMKFFSGRPNFTNSAAFTAAEVFFGGFSAVVKKIRRIRIFGGGGG